MGGLITDLGTESEIPNNSDNLVCKSSSTDGTADDNIHPLLRVAVDLVVDREEL